MFRAKVSPKIFLALLLASLSMTPEWASGERILFFFGGGSYSMKNSAWPWATELADRGHNVTFLSAHTKKPTEHEGVQDVTAKTLKDVLEFSYGIDRFQQRQKKEEKDVGVKYSEWALSICETILLKSDDDSVLQKIIHEDSYDLVIVNVIFGECGFIFAAKYKAKTILFDGSVPLPWFFDLYGFQPDTASIPDLLTTLDEYPLGFLDRVLNSFWPLYWYFDRNWRLYPGLEGLMRQLFQREEVPSFYDLEKNASLVVINSHPATDFVYSFPPFVLQIGGIQTFLPEQQIPEKYQKFMDEAGPDGVVLISFGSTIPLEKLPSHYADIFFGLMMKHKKVRFLLKWKGPLPDKYANVTSNVLPSDWLPQREILRHPKLKAFVSHGGLNSIQEATYYGVPLIVMPLFADQDYNAFRVHAQKVGFRVEIRDLTLDILDTALLKLLKDPQYKRNMVVRSKIFRDRPQSPIQTVAFWTEFVLRNDDVSALKPMNSNLNLFQRRLFDVYAFCVGVIFIIVFAVIIVGKKLMVSLLRTSSAISKYAESTKLKRH